MTEGYTVKWIQRDKQFQEDIKWVCNLKTEKAVDDLKEEIKRRGGYDVRVEHV